MGVILMDITTIIVSIIGVLIGVKLFRSNRNDEKIEGLKEKAAELKGELKAMDEQRDTLKETITKEQKNISEEGKTQFWEEYLGKKDE